GFVSPATVDRKPTWQFQDDPSPLIHSFGLVLRLGIIFRQVQFVSTSFDVY
ncbi:hypothetical protein LINGRAPRIM_LOCUS138, partial [Linum grandiflorum]